MLFIQKLLLKSVKTLLKYLKILHFLAKSVKLCCESFLILRYWKLEFH